MKKENINNTELPKEIKSENENINPLLDIISSIQEKLDSVNTSNTANTINNSNTYTNSNHNFSFSNDNNMGFNSNSTPTGGFDTSKLFEILGNINSNNQKNTYSASNPFANLDMDTMMRLGKIFTNMNRKPLNFSDESQGLNILW